MRSVARDRVGAAVRYRLVRRCGQRPRSGRSPAGRSDGVSRRSAWQRPSRSVSRRLGDDGAEMLRLGSNYGREGGIARTAAPGGERLRVPLPALRERRNPAGQSAICGLSRGCLLRPAVSPEGNRRRRGRRCRAAAQTCSFSLCRNPLGQAGGLGALQLPGRHLPRSAHSGFPQRPHPSAFGAAADSELNCATS